MTVRVRVLWAITAVLWLGAAVAGLTWVMNYDTRPGVAADAPADWPTDSAIPRDAARPTLVMLAHPRCDCTRASLGELAELMARASHRPRAFVVFIRPDGVGSNWDRTSLSAEANEIAGVTVMVDERGDEARRFRVQTSGQTLLYGAEGHLLYSGGITAARGKPGDSAGRASLLTLLDVGASSQATGPVFGCPLFAAPERPITEQGHAHGS